ncbi:hypothetical protein [Ferrovibrio sp.]
MIGTALIVAACCGGMVVLACKLRVMRNLTDHETHSRKSGRKD